MSIKSLTYVAIFGLFWGSIAGTVVDQFGIYGGSPITTTERSNAELRCMNINPQNSVDLEQVRYDKIISLSDRKY